MCVYTYEWAGAAEEGSRFNWGPNAADMANDDAALEVCCSVLQCVAVCCSVLRCVAVCCSVHVNVANNNEALDV